MESLPARLGPLTLLDKLQAGGMGVVYVGRRGPAGPLSRLVAVKRVHPHFLAEDAIRGTFVDEARVALSIRHPNCVATEEVVTHGGELLLVMELLDGVSAGQLGSLARKRNERLPIPIVLAIIEGALRGLHAAHETVDADGNALGLVHRDVSPQNLFVCADGTAKLLDFGVVMAVGRIAQTAEGVVKGKFPYMAPEQLRRGKLDRRTDLYSLGVVLWEMLTTRRLVPSNEPMVCMDEILNGAVKRPSVFRQEVPAWLDDLCIELLCKDRDARPASAEAVAERIRSSGEVASPSTVAAYVTAVAGSAVMERRMRNRALSALEAPQLLPPNEGPTTTAGLGATVHAPLTAPASPPSSKLLVAAVLASLALGALAVFRDSASTGRATSATAPPSSAPVARSTYTRSEPAAEIIMPPSPAVPPPASSEPPRLLGVVSAAPRSAVPPTPVPSPFKPGPVRPKAPTDCATRPFNVVDGIKQFRPECPQ